MKNIIGAGISQRLLQALVGCIGILLLLQAQAEIINTATTQQGAEKGLLWKVTSKSGKKSFLFGTIHSEDARVLDYPDVLLESLKETSVFAMELVPNMPTLSRLMEAMRYPDQVFLEDKIGAELYQQVKTKLLAYGLPESGIKHLKLWAAAMTLSVPPPETGMFLDFSLSLRAASMGARLTALETLDEQVGFLEGMLEEDQLTMLRQAVLESDQMQQQNEAMIEIWLSRDLAKLTEVARAQMAEMEPRIAEWFQVEGIDKRNKVMLTRAMPLLEQGGVFVAVGALHLSGDTGLIKLLRETGFQLEPLW